MSLAWESASPVPCLSLWERWPSAARTERANKEEPPSGGSFSLSINPLYGVSGSFTQGELEGTKPASNKIKCRAKPCLARRAWSTPRVLASRREATIFVPQGGTKITTLFQAVEKAGGFFDSLGKPPCRAALFTSIHASVPSMFTTCTVRGMSFPLRSSAALTAYSSPPQQGTSIRSSVTERMSLLCSTAASFSV